MPKNTPTRRCLSAHLPTSRVVRYVDPAPRQEVLILTPQQQAAYVADRQREYALAYRRWQVRQAQIAEYDRKVRRFWLGFGAVVGTAFLAGVVAAIWLVCHLATATGLGLLIVPLLALGVTAVVAGGRRCVTVVQHWH